MRDFKLNLFWICSDDQQQEQKTSFLIPLDCEVDSSCVNVKPYEEARKDLEEAASNNGLIKFWMPSSSTTYGMYSVVDEVRV